MAPVKFGLFRARSRDHPEPPSTENLLQSGHSTEMVSMGSLGSPTSSKHELYDDIPALRLQGENDDRIASDGAFINQIQCITNDEDCQNNYDYKPLKDPTSTSISTDREETQNLDDLTQALDLDDGASTSCDANSIQFDECSIAPSEDISVYCGGGRRPKKFISREEQQIRDLDMWHASNVEVMQNLLSRSGTMDEQIKWEAIATSRGLCTLTDSCTCGDCARTMAGVTDGDGGLGTAPLFNAISVGCCLQ